MYGMLRCCNSRLSSCEYKTACVWFTVAREKHKKCISITQLRYRSTINCASKACYLDGVVFLQPR